MGRCRDCRFWEPNTPRGIPYRDYDARNPDDAQACYVLSSPSVLRPGDPDDLPEARAFPATEDSELVMRTYPDFGCVQFEAKHVDAADEQSIIGMLTLDSHGRVYAICSNCSHTRTIDAADVGRLQSEANP